MPEIGACGHVYELAKNLDLLDYARHTIGRRTIMEAPIFLTIYFERKKIEGYQFPVYVAPGLDWSEWQDTIEYHLEKKLKFYNPITAALADQPVEIDLFSSAGREPFRRGSLRDGIPYSVRSEAR